MRSIPVGKGAGGPLVLWCAGGLRKSLPIELNVVGIGAVIAGGGLSHHFSGDLVVGRLMCNPESIRRRQQQCGIGIRGRFRVWPLRCRQRHWPQPVGRAHVGWPCRPRGLRLRSSRLPLWADSLRAVWKLSNTSVLSGFSPNPAPRSAVGQSGWPKRYQAQSMVRVAYSSWSAQWL